MTSVAAKVVLVLATLLFLASMGGGMLLAVWLLVPLHWLAARDSGPLATGGWAVLAGASVAQVAWMGVYVLTRESEAAAITTMPVAFVVATAAFLVLRSRREPVGAG